MFTVDSCLHITSDGYGRKVTTRAEGVLWDRYGEQLVCAPQPLPTILVLPDGNAILASEVREIRADLGGHDAHPKVMVFLPYGAGYSFVVKSATEAVSERDRLIEQWRKALAQ